jgi:hypothetical protein
MILFFDPYFMRINHIWLVVSLTPAPAIGVISAISRGSAGFIPEDYFRPDIVNERSLSYIGLSSAQSGHRHVTVCARTSSTLSLLFPLSILSQNGLRIRFQLLRLFTYASLLSYVSRPSIHVKYALHKLSETRTSTTQHFLTS